MINSVGNVLRCARLRAGVLVVALTVGSLHAQPSSTGNRKKPATSASSPQGELSEAERIARLNRSIKENRTLLAELRARLEDPESDYAQAEQAFQVLDQQLEAKTRELEQAAASQPADRVQALKDELAAIRTRWQLARERFDLAIKERRTLQERTVTLEQQIASDEQALQRLTATAPAATAPAATAPASPPPATTPEAPATPAPATPPALPGGLPLAPSMPDAAAPDASPNTPSVPETEELRQAREQAREKDVVARAAEEEARTYTDQLINLERAIQLEQQLLATTREKVVNARSTRQALAQEIEQLASAGKPYSEYQHLWQQVSEARQRIADLEAQLDERSDRLEELHRERADLQAAQIASLDKARAARADAKESLEQVEWLENPFSPQNLYLWAVKHGPVVGGILLGMFVLLWLMRFADERLVGIVAGRTERGTTDERENRARTLVGVFHNAATVIIIAGGILMILAEIGLSIVPLMGGVAVVGLAVAFGAQNLIRDFFSGFMILLENQYGINDVIKIGGTGGLVERVTLRVTVLRDLEGIAHFIPNGEITKVSNLTHQWSRVVLDVPVAYKEDPDVVMNTIREVAMSLRHDPNFRWMILEDPEMLGLDAFGDSALIFKMIIKTRTLQQWNIKRAMLYRLKKRFDELGIEIPFPHRTVYHRTDSPLPVPPPAMPSNELPSPSPETRAETNE